MNKTTWLSALGIATAAFLHANPTATVFALGATPSTDPAPVLVELFTSEGCSSCPPADTLLSKLQADQPIPGVQVIGLEEHVDYWNHDGWVDPYSAADWTVRQEDYVASLKSGSPYTPQMVVDGQRTFVGSNPRDAVDAIRQAAQLQKISVSISPAATQGDAQRFDVRLGSISTLLGGHDKADVWLAVTEESVQTSVKAGENGGRSWEHAAIARSLQKIGSAAANDSEPFVARPEIKLKSNWKKENLRVVVFVQDRKTHRVIGAASVKATMIALRNSDALAIGRP